MTPDPSSLRSRKDDSFSLARCSWLLKQRGLEFISEESIHDRIPDRGTHPDFFVETRFGGSFLVEVESFIEPVRSFTLPVGVAQISLHAQIKWMQVAIKNGARQLRPYAALGIPLVVVLDNHRLCRIPSNVEFLRDAAFGQTEFRATWNPARGQLDDLRVHHGSGQILSTTRKTYISAVLWNTPKTGFGYTANDEEVPMKVTGVLNHYANVPLPPSIFNDQEDRLFGYDETGTWRSRQGE